MMSFDIKKSAVATGGPKRFNYLESFSCCPSDLTLMAHFINGAILGSAIRPDPSLGKSIRLSLSLQYLKPFIPNNIEHKVTQVFISLLSVKFAFNINESFSVWWITQLWLFAAHTDILRTNSFPQNIFFKLQEEL